MSSRHRYAHTRRHSIHSSVDPIQLEVLVRDTAAEPVIINDLADAGLLAFELFSIGMTVGALVLLDERRNVVAVLLDPPLGIDEMLRWAHEPGLRAEFHQVLGILARDRIIEAPPADQDIVAYREAQEMCLALGVLWLDLLVTSSHALQSIGIVCDPDSVWNDPVEF